jgi:hypothetical protein
VHIVWPTVIGGDEPEGALFYASTADGRRFTPRIRVPTLGSPKPGHPQIIIDARGRLIVAWDEIVDGRRIAAIREMKRSGPVAAGPVVDLSPEASAIYPVLAATDTGVVATWTTVGEPTVVQVKRVSLP